MSSKKKYARVNFEIYESACKKLQINPRVLAEELGYSRTAINSWQKSGKFPKVASIACEGLIRRSGKSKQIVVSADKLEVIKGDGVAKEIHPGIFVIEM